MIRLSGGAGHEANLEVVKHTSVRKTYPIHTHEYYEFFFVTKGRAIHIINGALQVVERGSLVFVRPDDEHCYDYYKTQDFEFYNAGFTIEMFEAVNALFEGYPKELLESPLPKHIKLNEEQTYHITNALEATQSLKIERERKIILGRIISYVVYQMLMIKEIDQGRMLPTWLIHLMDEMSIAENFIEGLPCLLRLCNYSQEHINREFKRYLNTTPTRYINEMRLRYARDLLVKSDKEIMEVCQSSGFNNLSHFYTEFKRYYGYPPNVVRRSTDRDNTVM